MSVFRIFFPSMTSALLVRACCQRFIRTAFVSLLLIALASPSFGQGRGTSDGMPGGDVQPSARAQQADTALPSSRTKALAVFDFDSRGYTDLQLIPSPLSLSKDAFDLVFEDLNTTIPDFEYQTARTGDLNYQASGKLVIRTADDSEIDMQSIDLGFTDPLVTGSDVTITGDRNGTQVAQITTTSVIGGVNTTIPLSSSDSGFSDVDHVEVSVNTITGGDGIQNEFATFDNVTVDDAVPANTAPAVATNTGSTVDEGTNDTVTQSELETTDSEQGASSLTYTIDTDVTEGNLFNGSTQLDQSDTFTQADVNAGTIEYRHDGSEPVSGVSFDFTVTDGAGGSTSGSFGFTVNAVNDAPTISTIADQTIEEDGTLNAVSFTVDDVETSDLSTLSLSGASDNTTLVPNSGISLTGPDATGNASVTVQPAANKSGSATITVTVDDGAGSNNTASDSFVLTVNAVPDLAITDGSSSNLDFSGDVSPGTNDNPVGIFALSASQTGATLNEVTVTHDAGGTTGITNARLYLSSDQTLEPGSDTQVASFDVTDSGAEPQFPFTGIATAIPTSPVYAIVAIDVAAGVSGDVQFELAQASDLTVTDGEIATVNGSTQSTFSALPLSNAPTALPVEMTSFEATTSGPVVTLRWQTASETRNSGFVVQRKASPSASVSRGGNDRWADVGEVEGSGTTTNPQSYRFIDESVPYESDALTYRLKQIDTDGRVSFSKEVSVARDHVKRLNLRDIYPNPAHDQATVRFAVPEGSREEVSLRLYDVMGRQVQSLHVDAGAGRHEFQLSVDDLVSGIYVLRLVAGTDVRTKKISVVH